jgi:hypothetical protein
MIETERLVLRSWRDEDVAPFQVICSDPEVMATAFGRSNGATMHG